MNRKLITIGYSTLSNRVQKIALPIQRDEVEILIAVQGEYADPIEREDVRMIYLDGFGAAKSRNVILREAGGEILFFGDDDMRWDESGLIKTIEYLQMNENVDLVLCQSENEFGQLRKRYFRRGSFLPLFLFVPLLSAMTQPSGNPAGRVKIFRQIELGVPGEGVPRAKKISFVFLPS